jgi:hypothetical protein
MLQHTYQHDYKPTHKPRPVAIVEAEEEAAWCWKRLDEYIDNRHEAEAFSARWWEEHDRLLKAAYEAEQWAEDQRALALNCTCDPDPRRESAVCPACRAVNAEKEMEF